MNDRDTIQPPAPTGKLDRSQMSDRDLLLSLHSRLDEIEERLEDGERRFSSIETDWTIAMRYLESVNLHLGRKVEAARIDAIVEARRPSSNGGLREEDTDPGIPDAE